MTPALNRTQAAWLLGLAGLIPFAAPAALALADNTAWLGAQHHYAACILAFLGALHWGPALNESARQPAWLLAWGVMPSLMAWVALQWGGVYMALNLAAGLALTLLADWILARFHSWPAYYLKLRCVLTALACASLLLPRWFDRT